jgi:hypothetical protein
MGLERIHGRFAISDAVQFLNHLIDEFIANDLGAKTRQGSLNLSGFLFAPDGIKSLSLVGLLG